MGIEKSPSQVAARKRARIDTTECSEPASVVVPMQQSDVAVTESSLNVTIQGQQTIGEYNVNLLYDTIKALEVEIKSISKISIAERNRLSENLSSIRDVGFAMSLEIVGLKGQLKERLKVVETLNKQGKEPINNKVSYAQTLKNAVILEPGVPKKNRKTKAQWKSTKVVRVQPIVGKEGNFANSEAINTTVRALINPAASGLAINKVNNVSNGIIIETSKDEDIEFFLKNKELQEAGLIATLPEKKLPRVIVYDVDRTEKLEDIKVSIIKQNNGEITSDDIKIGFRTGPRNSEVVQWVLEVSPKARNTLLNKRRVYIGWSSCKVSDYVRISRCFKCHVFGHIAKFCKVQDQICGHCTEVGHDHKSCPKKAEGAKCVSCKRSNKAFDHSSKSRICSAYKKALDLVARKTVYDN